MFQLEFRRIHDPSEALADVVWMNHAGGGTNTLVQSMRQCEEVLPVRILSPRLPGREELIGVSFEGDLNDLAAMIAGQIADQREREATDRPLVLIGHSFGSLLAYQVARELIDRGITPHRMVVLACPAPSLIDRDNPLHQLEDDALIEKVSELFGGIPEEVRQDESARRFFVAGLRFDLKLFETHEPGEAQAAAVEMTAISGTEDRTADVAHMHGWKQWTSSAFRLRAMPGDHFFPLSRMPEIVRIALWDVLPG